MKLGKRSASHSGMCLIEANLNFITLSRENLAKQMKSILHILIPNKSLQMIYLTETQNPKENPESYIARKQLLAYLAHVIRWRQYRQEYLDYG